MLFYCSCSYLPCFTPSEHSDEVTHCGTGMLWVFVLHAWSTDPLLPSPSPSIRVMWLLPFYSVRRWSVKGNVLGSPEVLASVLGRPCASELGGGLAQLVLCLPPRTHSSAVSVEVALGGENSPPSSIGSQFSPLSLSPGSAPFPL